MTGIVLLVYIVVALLNYSVVQSIAGSIAGNYLSQETHGVVKVGGISANLLGQVVVHDAILIDPAHDTVAYMHRVRCSFDRFPYHNHSLNFNKVVLRNGYFHFDNTQSKTSLDFLLNYLSQRFPPKKSPSPHERFTIRINRIDAHDLAYKQTLKPASNIYDGVHGVDVYNMHYRDVNFRVRNLRVDGDHITCDLEKFRAHEQSGFVLDNFSAHVYVASNGISATNMELQSDSTHLLCDVLLRYNTWETMQHYVDSVYMFANFKPGTTLDGRTAGYWTEVLWGVDDIYNLEGVVYGSVNDLHCNDLLLRFGHGSECQLDAALTDVTRIKEAQIDANIYRLTTNHGDLDRLAILHQFGVTLPDLLKQMGSMDITLQAQGGMEGITARCDVNSAVGQVDVNAWMLKDERSSSYTYYANIESPNLQVSQLVSNDWVTSSGCHLTLQGEGIQLATMVASVEGSLTNTMLRGNRIKTSLINAQLADGVVDANLRFRDSVMALNFNAHLNQGSDSTTLCDINATILRADLKRLKLISDHDSMLTISTHLDGHAQWGNHADFLESIDGQLKLDHTDIVRNHKGVKLDSLVLSVGHHDGEKALTLNTDIMKLKLNGYYTFKALPDIVHHFCDHYIPKYFNPYLSQQPIEDNATMADAMFDLRLEYNDPSRKLAFLLPTVQIANGTVISGSYNYAESIKLVLRSDSLSIGSIVLDNIGLHCREQGGQYVVQMSLDKIRSSQTPIFDNLNLHLSSDSRSMLCDLNWDDRADTLSNNADIALMMRSDSIKNTFTLLRNNINIHGTRWYLTNEGPCIVGQRGILIDNLTFQSITRRQAIFIDGRLMDSPNDRIDVSFDHFELGQFAFLLGDMPLKIDGSLNGTVSVKGFDETPHLDAALVFNQFNLNNVDMGDADVHSSWNAELNQLNLYVTTSLFTPQGVIAPLQLQGFVDMTHDEKVLDFDLNINDLPLEIAQPFIDNVTSHIDGTLQGEITIDGTLDALGVEGYLALNESKIDIDFLNTSFAINDTIYLDRDRVRLDHFTIHDTRQGELTLNGALRHHHFKDLALDFDLNAHDLLCMNTRPHYDDFFGSLVIDADGTISGPMENLNAEMNATTRPGTELHLPISNRKDIQAASFIHFVEPASPFYYVATGTDQRPSDVAATTAKPAFNYKATINVFATPDAHLYLPVDIPNVTVDIAATGGGELMVQLATGAQPSVLGDYEISDGTLDLSLAGLITKKFSIAEGSTITFPGDISRMNLNVDAIYSQRVSTATLSGESSIDGNAQNITVQSVISVAGTMNSPEVSFDLRLPNADPSVQEEVFSYIDRTNEIDMLNQTMSLLVFNRFYNNNSTASATTGNLVDNGRSSGYSVVANTLGSLVSDAVEFVNVGFDYKSATELTGQQIDVDISKEWNKFYFESTFGFGTDARAIDNNGNNITGDVLLGYKVNPRLHFFVFNRSNTNDYTRTDLPFKQGVGMKYVREFDSLRDLLKRKK